MSVSYIRAHVLVPAVVEFTITSTGDISDYNVEAVTRPQINRVVTMTDKGPKTLRSMSDDHTTAVIALQKIELDVTGRRR